MIAHFAWDRKTDADGVDRRRKIREEVGTQQAKKIWSEKGGRTKKET